MQTNNFENSFCTNELKDLRQCVESATLAERQFRERAKSGGVSPSGRLPGSTVNKLFARWPVPTAAEERALYLPREPATPPVTHKAALFAAQLRVTIDPSATRTQHKPASFTPVVSAPSPATYDNF